MRIIILFLFRYAAALAKELSKIKISSKLAEQESRSNKELKELLEKEARAKEASDNSITTNLKEVGNDEQQKYTKILKPKK